MAWSFGESWDPYATINDSIAGYWDSGSFGALTAGRFAGGQAYAPNTTTIQFTKSSAVNDAVHHFSLAFRQTAVISGTTLGWYLQLLDGTTGQCAIVFRQDGAILLTSGGPGGTVLDTYTGAVTAQNTWFQFEFEITINNTTGSWAVRKNGNTVNDRALGGLNTRPGTNTYANKLQMGVQGTFSGLMIDDLLWRSDASSVPFVGDIRAYTRMPASDAAVQFARSPNPSSVSQISAQSSTASKAANAGMMSAFTANYTGTIASGTISVSVGGTGNMKAAIYDATRVTPLATSNAVVNPIAGSNVIIFGTPLAVTRGTTYCLAVDQDTTIVYNVTGSSANQGTFTTTYASFPATNPGATVSGVGLVGTINITPTISAEFVNETLQDGATSYVYDSTVNDADFYTIAAIASTPATVVAVTTRAFIQKSDAGTRGAAVQLKSGATTVTSTPTLLSSSFGWLWRTDLVDPNTSTAWTAASVNNIQIGPKVTS